jgi:hypothetical protein
MVYQKPMPDYPEASQSNHAAKIKLGTQACKHHTETYFHSLSLKG